MEKMNSYLFLLLSITMISLLQFGGTAGAATTTKIGALYAFGDSVFDAGNNNALATICRADHRPYGIDFPGQKATGRFSNGRLAGDMLISDLGIKSVLPAYAELKGEGAEQQLVTGATFASSCSGLDDLTAREVNALTMSMQLRNFQEAFLKMQGKFGIQKAVAAVESALFLVSAGSNDMMDNYYALPGRGLLYSLPQYHDNLIANLEDFVKKLHSAGAKRLALVGLPPLGCLPMDVTSNNFNLSGKRECRSKHNSDAKEYNVKLQVLVKKMTVAMPHIKIAYFDIYRPIMDMIATPHAFGFKSTLVGCCGSGAVEVGPLCSVLTPMCQQRSEYVFFDAAHPTESAYRNLTNLFKEKVLPTLLK